MERLPIWFLRSQSGAASSQELVISFTVSILICLGIWISAVAKSLHFTQDERRQLVKTSLGLLGLWLLVIAGLSVTGALNPRAEFPPPLLLIPVLSLLAVALLHWAVISKEILTVTPKHWPVAIQTFRIGVELAILGLFLSGRAPIQITFEGRNFDILVGLTAPVVAIGILKFRLNNLAVIAWNLIGLAVLGTTVFTILSSVPGPLHLNWPGVPFTELKTWPVVWLPAFLAPFAVAAHIFSLRQCGLRGGD